jgi:hypothetical protein
VKRTPVKSTNIAAIGYDSASRTLEVEFKSGGVYEYKSVTPATALAFKRAKSKGNYFASVIKNKYEGKKL